MNEEKVPNIAKWAVGVLLLVSAVILVAINSYTASTVTIVILVAFTFVFALRPRLGLYAMALCLPLINLNFNLGRLVIPFIDALAIIAVLGFVIHSFITQHSFKQLKFPFFTPFVLFFLAYIFSAVGSAHVSSSLWYSCRWILFFYIAYVFYPVNIIRDRKILKGVLISFLISACLMGIMGIISLKDQSLSNDPFRFTVLTIYNQKPFGLDQNLLVETLLPAIFFLLALGYWYKKEQPRKAVFITNLFLIFILLGTFSRGGWIGLMVCLALYIVYGKKMNFPQVFFSGIITLIILIPLFIHMFNLQTNFNVGVGSNQTRWLSTQIAWSNFTESPWIGKGAGEYVYLIDENIRFKAQHGEATDSNGVIQKVMAESGIVGLLTFGILAYYIFYTMYKKLRYGKLDRRLILPICLGALSIFIFEFFNTSYFHGKLWLPIAIAWAAVMLEDKKP